MTDPNIGHAQANGSTVAPARTSAARRIGCGLMLILWFAVLLLPCFLVTLAVQQEIVIGRSGAPGELLRVWLIMEPDQRGLGVSTTALSEPAPGRLCVQTDTRFVLWQGSEPPRIYCECYQRAADEGQWSLVSMENGVCSGG